jgi:hypothetical protein
MGFHRVQPPTSSFFLKKSSLDLQLENPWLQQIDPDLHVRFRDLPG